MRMQSLPVPAQRLTRKSFTSVLTVQLRGGTTATAGMFDFLWERPTDPSMPVAEQ